MHTNSYVAPVQNISSANVKAINKRDFIKLNLPPKYTHSNIDDCFVQVGGVCFRSDDDVPGVEESLYQVKFGVSNPVQATFVETLLPFSYSCKGINITQ